jgi:hypothetical protein
VVTQRFDLPRDVGHFALHAAVFDFVLHECLCNSLDGFRSYVRILLDVRPTERRHDERDLAVVLTIENDVMANAATGQGSGIAACETAANAVGGTFQSRGANSGWRAVLTLPVYRVPHALTRWLYELLR